MWTNNVPVRRSEVRRSKSAAGVGLWAMMMVGPLLYGCASTDDLDALRATMSATISANKRSLDGRIHQLEEARKKSDEQHAQLMQLTKEAVAKIGEVERIYQAKVGEYQQSMSRLADTVKTNSGEIDDLRQNLQHEQGAIARVLDAEEAFHKEGLRSVQAIRDDLGSVKGKWSRHRGASSMRQDTSADLSFDERLLR
jgi:chromosome segregation ATPase